MSIRSELMSHKELKRICPKCNKEILYSTFKSYYNATLNNKNCKYCCNIGQHAWNKGLRKETNEKVRKYSESLKIKWDKSKKAGSRTVWNKGLTVSDERVKKYNEKRRESLMKLYAEGIITPWNKGKPFIRMRGEGNPSKRPEVREKLRIGTLMNYVNRNGVYKCNFNPKACDLFDIINKEMNWKGLHALNYGKEYFITQLGYCVDYYEPHWNIVIEYYEKWHNKTRFIEKDKIRQQRIEETLGCHFYIINQGKEHLWKETIHAQFWLQAQRGL